MSAENGYPPTAVYIMKYVSSIFVTLGSSQPNLSKSSVGPKNTLLFLKLIPSSESAIPMTEVSESIVADSAEQVLNYVLDQLKTHLEYEFVGIIRRNPILTILKDNK